MSRVDTATPWQRYICRACGLIYDEQHGDTDSGLAPGTRFADIPEDWQCPLCGVTKADFELFERPTVNTEAQSGKRNPYRPGSAAGVLVIGAGIAGWSIVEAIRRRDAAVEITLITACNGDVYHKPELSVAIARGLDQRALIRENGSEAARRLKVSLVANTIVSGISSAVKIVRSTRGSFPYCKLVLAQGAQSQVPENIPPQWCWRINHLSAWSGLQHRLAKQPARIAIIGAGMIGCELAENLRTAGHEVYLIFRGDTPLAKLLPPVAGQRFAELLSREGVHCVSNTVVESVELLPHDEHPSGDSNQGAYRLNLSHDKHLISNHIVAATGLAGDKRLALVAGLEYDKGIVVNPVSLQTSADDIYALGDCVSLAGAPCRFIAPIAEQAKVIASRICDGEELSYQHRAPVIRLKVQSCSLMWQGVPRSQGEWRLVSDMPNKLTMKQLLAGEIISTLELALAV
ncbi:MAG: FAD-dependent oxidoreductase [Cellvibrionaceae bacterium]|nr:FAD-dependent oxidoreductase [Cellvibrionaceae bacterium]